MHADAMMNVRDIERTLFARFPASWAESWDKVGLSVGDPCAPVEKIALALDATPDAICAAASAGASVLVTHHPVYLSAPAVVMPGSAGAPLASTALWEAIRGNVALVAMHTNLDRSQEATGRLPQMLGLAPTCGIERGRREGAGALGSVADLEITTMLDAFADRCRAVFGRIAQVYGRSHDRVSRAAFFTGSLGDCGADALAASADVVVCGECGYHRALDLTSQGCAVIILGHDVSELPLVDVLEDSLVDTGVSRARLVRVGEAPVWYEPGRPCA